MPSLANRGSFVLLTAFKKELLRGAIKQQEVRECLFPRIEGVPDRGSLLA